MPLNFGADPDHDPDPGFFKGRIRLTNVIIITFQLSYSLAGGFASGFVVRLFV